MWLPTPVYERIPQFWFLLGLLFMSAGTYIGFDYQLSFLYFAVGFACSVWSLCVFAMRYRARKVLRQQQKAERPQGNDAEQETRNNSIRGAESAA